MVVLKPTYPNSIKKNTSEEVLRNDMKKLKIIGATHTFVWIVQVR